MKIKVKIKINLNLEKYFLILHFLNMMILTNRLDKKLIKLKILILSCFLKKKHFSKILHKIQRCPNYQNYNLHSIMLQYQKVQCQDQVIQSKNQFLRQIKINQLPSFLLNLFTRMIVNSTKKIMKFLLNINIQSKVNHLNRRCQQRLL